MNFWNDIKKPIKVLAPMAGYTDAAFRLICREFGADVTMSELVSADAIAYSGDKFEIRNSKYEIKLKSEIKKYNYNKAVTNKNQSTADLLSFFEEERPFVVQLFGKDPNNFAKAAKVITEIVKPDGIDINMGCPARKVIGSDHGAALIKSPVLATDIVRAVKDNTNLPVSVKTRLGWDDKNTILEFAPELKKAGISALIVHARTYKMGFSGNPDWENIFKLKEIFGEDLTVIGNGGICGFDTDNIEIFMKENGETIKKSIVSLDGFAIGQKTIGQPWVFSGSEPDHAEVISLIKKHARLLELTKGLRGVLEFRKHFLVYLKKLGINKELKSSAVKVENYEDIENIVANIE